MPDEKVSGNNEPTADLKKAAGFAVCVQELKKFIAALGIAAGPEVIDFRVTDEDGQMDFEPYPRSHSI